MSIKDIRFITLLFYFFHDEKVTKNLDKSMLHNSLQQN